MCRRLEIGGRMKTKGVRLYGAGDVRLEEFELPPLKSDEILLRIMSDSMCMSTWKECKLGAEHIRVSEINGKKNTKKENGLRCFRVFRV